ncbi:stage II sporulation protein M [Paenibacillus thermotolerans]|uniref:stage II sporulation protein M n=1 Tax=Paenibacillus thermotolerans TaxID=3027807 RepID=UPI002367DA9A|nr:MULTISPECIES: stage II sporulation protein M [unclassified Paenibacillus]
MELTSFIKRHKPLWTELERAADSMQRRAARLTAGDVDRFTALHKQVSAHLSFMNSNYPGNELTGYLNKLVSRSHNVLYRDSWSSTEGFKRFFATGFVSLLKERAAFIAFAAILMAAGFISGFAVVMNDPHQLSAIAPPQFADVDPSRIAEDRGDLTSSIDSAAIMTNNIRVAVLCFVSGITLGIGTLYLLVYNGVLIGALAAVFFRAGESYAFWAFILPHGVIELTAIFIAGGAGLYMGYVMMVPGPYTRKYRFFTSVRESVQLLLGTVPLFVVAGTIEGYVTPACIPLEAKYFVAALTLAALVLYYLYGRKRLQLQRVS